MEVKEELERGGKEGVREGDRVRGGIPGRENIKCNTPGNKKWSGLLRKQREVEYLRVWGEGGEETERRIKLEKLSID